MTDSSKIEKGTKVYYRAIVALFLGSLTAFGAEYCVQPIIPVLADDFGLGPAAASLAVSFGTVGLSVSMLFIAMMASRFARRRTMLIGLGVASLLAILISLSGYFELVLAFRFVQGIMLAAFPSMAVAYIDEEFSSSIVGTVVGIYVSGTSIGGLLGRLLLSACTDLWGWRYALAALGGVYLLITLVFFLLLPAGQHHNLSQKTVRRIPPYWELLHLMKNPHLMKLFIIGMCIMGSFVCCYNFISYVLLAEPYCLSQTTIGFVYFMYFVGTFSSAFMGMVSDKHGNGVAVVISIFMMLAGVLITMFIPLACKLIGLAMFTYGFFGAHSSACSWAGKLDKADKAQITAMYMFLYYMGASIFGAAGGIFLVDYGWNGIVAFLTVLLSVALAVAVFLYRGVPDNRKNKVANTR